MNAALAKRLREEAERLSGHSIDRGVQEAGIAANLANEAADAIDGMLAALKAVLAHKPDHADTIWEQVEDAIAAAQVSA